MQIVDRVSRFGVSAAEATASLNALHNKFRLLLWFSTNQPLNVRFRKSLREDVVISEHGLDYFRNVIGDFEYLWYCANELKVSSVKKESPSFVDKLQLYHDLNRKVGIVEWLQHSFARLESGAHGDSGRVGEDGSMLVLTLLYSSLGRLLRGVGIVFRQAGVASHVVSELYPKLKGILNEILFWQAKYRLMYLSDGFKRRYSEQITRISEGFVRHRSEGLLLDELDVLAKRLELSWFVDEPRTYASQLDLPVLSAMPTEDIVTLVAKYGRGVIPAVEKWVQSLDKQERVRSYIGAFLESRERLKILLSTRVPTYVDLQRELTYLHGDAEAVVATARDVAATGGVSFNWFLREKRVLSNLLEGVRANKYEVGGVVGALAMKNAKEKSNRLLAICETLSRSLLIKDHWHLSQSWSLRKGRSRRKGR